MPSFTVRRRKPRPKTPPPEEPKEEVNMEEKESDEELMSEDSDTSEYLDEAFEAMKMEPKTPQRRKVHFEPPNAPKREPQRRFSTAFEPRRPVNRQPLPAQNPQRRMNDPYTRKPTMINEISRSRLKRGGGKLRYTSHYGLAGEHLDTRTKATLLYQHCFQ